MAIRTYLSRRCADLRDSGMKWNPAYFFGRHSVRGFFITANVHFSLSPIPRIHLWLGHYSRHFQCCSRGGVQCCSSGGLVLFQSGGAVLLQRGSSAAPERESSAVPGGGLVLLQREVQCCSRRGSEQFRHGGSRAVPEGGQSCSRGSPNAAPEGVQCCSRGTGAPRAPNGQHRCRSSRVHCSGGMF